MPTYDYKRPAVTVDAVIFGYEGASQNLKTDCCVLLIQRGQDPFAGSWALPGGFVEENEPLDQAVARELEEETGLVNISLKQFYTFSDKGRDPRGWTLSVGYVGIVQKEKQHPQAASDAALVLWHPFKNLPALAFDHANIIQVAYKSL